jgi:hypothetical protein
MDGFCRCLLLIPSLPGPHNKLHSPLASASKLIMLQIVLSGYHDKDNDKYKVGFDRILLNKAKGFLGILAILQ